MSTHRGTMNPLTGVMDLHIEFMKVTEIMKIKWKVVKRDHIERK